MNLFSAQVAKGQDALVQVGVGFQGPEHCLFNYITVWLPPSILQLTLYEACMCTICIAIFSLNLQKNSFDDMPGVTSLLVHSRTSAVDVTTTEAVPLGLGKAARSKSDASLLAQDKKGASDATADGNMLQGETG